MSTKAFISAETHLTKLGFTVSQALEFINANLSQPEFIFDKARENGVTINMLSEISGYSTDIVKEYFNNAGLDSKQLNYTSILINSDLGSFESLVNFDNRSDILSTNSLDKAVQPLVHVLPYQYDNFFQSVYPNYQSNDGIYDAEELGVVNLVNVPATNESIKSLFYGSLINIFLALDKNELDQINAYPRNENPNGFQTLLSNALNESPPIDNWTNDELVSLVKTEAAGIIDSYYESDSGLVGVLDYSFLGLATATI